MSPSTPTTSRRRAFHRMVAGVALASALAVTTVAVWPASEAEKAHEDGEQVGAAVAALYEADTSAEVDDALAELDEAVTDTADHAGDAVSEELAETEDALARAADGFVGMHTADDDWSADVYEAELDDALGDLDEQGDDLREGVPEVEQEFWEGYEEGVSENS
ncbi:MAG: hypothetical protein M3389_09000 [Actinomycetota bacterium]|nr:hypothetical protein [Actinomycetota bacterium]